jgi:hypothetical protein
LVAIGLGFFSSAEAASVDLPFFNGQLRLSDGTWFDGTRPLDLTGRDLVIRATPATRTLIFDWVTNLVKNHRGFVNNSGVAADLAGWVVMLNDSGSGWPMFPRFADQAADVSSILVKYTWLGDVNLDGAVNLNDYFVIDNGYLAGAKGYAHGDVNNDGAVNLNDYFQIDSAYLGQRGGLSSSSALTATLSILSGSPGSSQTPVPPAIWSGCGLMGAVLLVKRLRRRAA